MNSLFALSADELVKKLGLEKKFQGKQIYSHLAKGETDFSAMSDLPKVLRERLVAEYRTPFSSTVIAREESESAVKFAIRLEDHKTVECVLLSDGEGRKTACLSSQVGCAMGCRFCKTGTMGLYRNLEAAEIVEQFVHLKQFAPELTHIVFMGMGEPLANFGQLVKAITFIHDPAGLDISLRRITVSTCGLVPGIQKLAEINLPVRLAVSLVSADNATRSSLMKVNEAFPLQSLKSALLNWQHIADKRITLEYCMLKGVNTTEKAAKDLSYFIKNLDAVVNLIPWNPIDELEYESPSEAEIRAFERNLDKLHIHHTRRISKGRDISGACGQLASKQED
jgi:23S rRNA m2A2503 methyltransferase